MAKVVAKNSENFDKTLLRFRRKVMEDGIIEQVRERQFFESKGEKAKKARDLAVRRNKRQLRKEAELFRK